MPKAVPFLSSFLFWFHYNGFSRFRLHYSIIFYCAGGIFLTGNYNSQQHEHFWFCLKFGYHKLGYDQLEKCKNYKKLETFNLVVSIILFQLVFVRNCCIFHDEGIKKCSRGGSNPRPSHYFSTLGGARQHCL